MDARQAEGLVEVISSAERVATTQDLEARPEALEAHLTRKTYSTAFLIITMLGALDFFA